MLLFPYESIYDLQIEKLFLVSIKWGRFGGVPAFQQIGSIPIVPSVSYTYKILISCKISYKTPLFYLSIVNNLLLLWSMSRPLSLLVGSLEWCYWTLTVAQTEGLGSNGITVPEHRWKSEYNNKGSKIGLYVNGQYREEKVMPTYTKKKVIQFSCPLQRHLYSVDGDKIRLEIVEKMVFKRYICRYYYCYR